MPFKRSTTDVRLNKTNHRHIQKHHPAEGRQKLLMVPPSHKNVKSNNEEASAAEEEVTSFAINGSQSSLTRQLTGSPDATVKTLGQQN